MNDIKQTQSLIKKKVYEVYSIIKYSSKIREFRKVLPKIKVSLPTFILNPIDGAKLYTCSLFGHITPLSTATEENVLSLNQPVKELLDEPKLIATIQTGFEKLRSVVCQNEEQICGLIKDIKCFNMTGSLVQTIQTKSDACPFDIALDSDGVYYTLICHHGQSIRLRKDKKYSHLLWNHGCPLICV